MTKATLKEAVPVRVGVILELTPDEAETLKRIGMLVGGEPNRSRRKHIDAINSALTSVGVVAPRAIDKLVKGEIYCTNEEGL